MRNIIIIGVVAILIVAGGFLNNRREAASACVEEKYTDFVKPEMIKGFLDKSIYFEAVKEAVASERLDPEQRPGYEDLVAEIETALELGEIIAREVSPSSSGSFTCDYTLVLAKNGWPDGDTTVRARFRLEIEELPGTEFEKKYNKRQRNIILLEELAPGQPVETVRVAELGRRTIVLSEPQFRGARFDHTFVPVEAISEGIISEIPK